MRFAFEWKRLGAATQGALLAVGLGLTGCDFLDPTDVNNPATTIDDLANADNPASSLLPGLRAQFARAINPVIPEVVSDNYSVHGTGINKTNDFPRQVTPDLIGGVYVEAQTLRSLAEFIIDDIFPVDEGAPAAVVQETRYYYGMAFLLLGERFVAAPVEVNGAPVASADLITRAITELTAAGTTGDLGLPVQAALARAYRLAGDAANAESAAQAVLAASPTFAQARDYDPGTVQNAPYQFLVARSLKEMQPLPRLDFLDPKYTSNEAAIYVAKAEEMHLILAEADFARGAYGAGKTHLADAVAVALARDRTTFEDNDTRLNEDLSPRPRDATFTVRSSPTRPYRAGLVLGRPGDVQTPTVSYTSLDADSIRIQIADTAVDDILHAFWLARQEMLLLEGRRMADLGIQLPVSLQEIETNDAVVDGQLGTRAVVPSYIPELDGMDLFTPASPYQKNPDGTFTAFTSQITITVDMNAVLAAERVSPFGAL